MALSHSWFNSWAPPANIFPQDFYQPEQFQPKPYQNENFQPAASTNALYPPELHFQNAPPNELLNFPPGAGNEQVQFVEQPQYFPHSHLNPYFAQDRHKNSSNILRLLPPLALLSVNTFGQVPVPTPSSPIFKPTELNEVSLRQTQQRTPLQTVYQWKLMDFEYSSPEERSLAIGSGAFIPENVIPLGLEVWQSRIFVTFPRWKSGVPITLATVPRNPGASDSRAPLMRPYPDWTFHTPGGDCSGLTSVFRIAADNCGNLWVLDSGQIEAVTNPQQLCPPQLFQFDLKTDKLVARHVLPSEYVLQNSLFTNVVVDSRTGDCSDLHVYIADVWRFGLLVFRPSDKKFWRFSNHLFFPDPLASDYTLHGINFQWTDGIFGMGLTPVQSDGDRTMFFHSMSGFREFTVKTSVLRDDKRVGKTVGEFAPIGETRGPRGQSSASAANRDGVLFFNLVSLDALGCWDMNKPYKRDALGIVGRDNVTMILPNDLKVDKEIDQNLWLLTNRLPIFLYSTLDKNDVNFRIFTANTRGIVRGTVCDPNVPYLGDPTKFDTC